MSGQHLVGEEAVGGWQKENVACPGLKSKTPRGSRELLLFTFIINVTINKGQGLPLYLIAKGFVIGYVRIFSHNEQQYRQERL